MKVCLKNRNEIFYYNTFKKERIRIYGSKHILRVVCECVLFLGEKTWEKKLKRREEREETRKKRGARRNLREQTLENEEKSTQSAMMKGFQWFILK